MNEPLGGCETYQLSISNQNKLHASYDPDVKNATLVRLLSLAADRQT